MLGITYKSAWFMAHRIREAMDDTNTTPMGGNGGTVEADETYIGTRTAHTKGQGTSHKHAVVTLVERGGRAKSFKVDKVTARDVVPIVRANVDKTAKLMTDEARHYWKVGEEFAAHGTVAHKLGQYGRGEVHTNTVEGYYSIFKRGMKGVYQHCSERHLQRYLAEFDFRYSNRAAVGCTDVERATKALKGIDGKRLTYRRINERAEAPSMG
jgi:transposase-like protein